jgi:uncharacterized protein (TIGR03437 family)
MWIEERKVPVVSVTPGSVRFLVPWDIGVSRQVRILAEVPGVHSPFDFPDSYISTSTQPIAGAIAHQNWNGLVDNGSGAPHAGEIIHIWAAGLGVATPEVPEGAAAPLATLSRLTAPLVCSGSEVLFAGLAPGYVERYYQVDLRLGSATGYTQIKCSLGSGDPFIFLSLNVVP